MPRISAREVIVIIMGASEWPGSPQLNIDPENHPENPFLSSKKFFHDYVTSKLGMDIPKKNVLDLFDKTNNPFSTNSKIRSFINNRKGKLKNISDVIYYYVGHGEYDDTNNYYVATKYINETDIKNTKYDIENISSILLELLGSSRHILIIDACYAAGAQTAYHRQDIGNSAKKVHQITRKYRPKSGTALFCAAGARQFAKTPAGDCFTMFTGAFESAIRQYNDDTEDLVSLRDLGREMEDIIRTKHGGDGVVPEIHTPVADEGDIASEKLFPRMKPAPDADEVLKYMQLMTNDAVIAMKRIKKEQKALEKTLKSLQQVDMSKVAEMVAKSQSKKKNT